MKILVTGADGFLGKEVVLKLRASYSDVVPVTRRMNGEDGHALCDLGNPTAIMSLLEEIRPDCIVNLAARADFSKGVLNELYAVNALCPAIFADYCRKHKAHLVQASGTIVLGFHNQYYNKDTLEIPDTDYGVSKLLAEKMIKASFCSAAIIRFGGIFGANGPEHLGINKAIMRSKSGYLPKVVASGAAKRNYIYVEDAASMIEKCITNRQTGLLMAGGETISIKDMLEFICDEFLPGKSPIFESGEESFDQVIEVSPELGPFRSFKDCLKACNS
jgi:nucleoside-diphosphate-sugar epimerase